MSRLHRSIVAAAFAWTVVGGAALALRQSSAPAAQDKPQAAAATFEVYKDRGGEYRWRLRSQNKQILATAGESYKAKRDCLNSIESVRKAAADAPVQEQADAPAEQPK